MALDLPQWAFKAIDKIRRGYLWRGRKDAKGGHCLIAWRKVTRPKELGGLGISDLQSLNWALRVRWLWLQKTEPNKPWASFQLQSNTMVQELFSMAMATELGDGNSTLFWKDRWLLGHRIQELAPNLLALIPKRIANRRTVGEALTDFRWLQDIHGTLSWPVLHDFLQLVEATADVHLQQGIPDKHFWRLSGNGIYSAKSAYEATFIGSTLFDASDRIWKAWAPPKCSFFMWLVAHNRCWTADRLAKRNLPHPSLCVLCDQEEESIDHLLVNCVFTWQFWFILLQRLGLAELSPQPLELSFDEWWRRAINSVNPDLKKGLNSLILLGAWMIRKHRNDCIFNAKSPQLSAVLVMADEEIWCWNMAGAKGLPLLTGHDMVEM